MMAYSIKTKISRIFASAFLLASLFFPILSYSASVAADEPAPPGSIVYVCILGRAGECNFSDVITAIRNLVNWATTFALGLSVVVIVYAGFLYMTSGANPGDRKKANAMLVKVFIGIAVVISAWLIVTLITRTLLSPNINTFLG